MKTLQVVAAIITRRRFEQGAEILATQRGYGDYKDWWEFPGGKIEEGEKPKEALVREILEELDMEIEGGEYLTTVEYEYPKFHLTMECFWCSIAEGEPHLLEHEAAKWLSIDDFRQVNWLPADIKVVEAIEQNGHNIK